VYSPLATYIVRKDNLQIMVIVTRVDFSLNIILENE